MRQINETTFPLMPIETRTGPGTGTVSFIVKATFDLVDQGVATVAAVQRPIMADTPFMDDIGRSLAWPTDMAPFKPNTGFLVIGSFHQPGGVATRTGRGSFKFGPLSKELLFLGPREATLDADGHWRIGDPKPMTSVPLRWELSYGGLADRRNPYGRGLDPEKAGGRTFIRLPQIERVEAPLRSIAERPEPANFAPVPPMFESRRRKLGTRDQRWALFRAPLPPLDYDPSHANAAPDDQQAGNSPWGDEVVELVNLHPTIPHLRAGLPGIRVRVAVLRQTAAGLVGEEVPMRIDTVILLPDENQVVLIWRGRTNVSSSNYETELPWVECDAQPLAPKRPVPSLPAQLLARVKAQEAGTEAARAAVEDQARGEAVKMLEKAGLPPALEEMVKTEKDPMKVFAALDAHIKTTLAALEKRVPKVG